MRKEYSREGITLTVTKEQECYIIRHNGAYVGHLQRLSKNWRGTSVLPIAPGKPLTLTGRTGDSAMESFLNDLITYTRNLPYIDTTKVVSMARR